MKNGPLVKSESNYLQIKLLQKYCLLPRGLLVCIVYYRFGPARPPLSYTAVIPLEAPRQLTWVVFPTVWIQAKVRFSKVKKASLKRY